MEGVFGGLGEAGTGSGGGEGVGGAFSVGEILGELLEVGGGDIAEVIGGFEAGVFVPVLGGALEEFGHFFFDLFDGLGVSSVVFLDVIEPGLDFLES
jgi:hypothetical protein